MACRALAPAASPSSSPLSSHSAPLLAERAAAQHAAVTALIHALRDKSALVRTEAVRALQVLVPQNTKLHTPS